MRKMFLPLRLGIAISSSLIAYFLVLRLLDLHTRPVYSLFNGVIIAFGIYESIKTRKLQENKAFNYTKGFLMGVKTGFLATFLFTTFLTFYITKIDLEFSTKLLAALRVGRNFETEIIILSSIVLGFLTTLILSFVFMQLFKGSDNTF